MKIKKRSKRIKSKKKREDKRSTKLPKLRTYPMKKLKQDLMVLIKMITRMKMMRLRKRKYVLYKTHQHIRKFLIMPTYLSKIQKFHRTQWISFHLESSRIQTQIRMSQTKPLESINQKNPNQIRPLVKIHTNQRFRSFKKISPISKGTKMK